MIDPATPPTISSAPTTATPLNFCAVLVLDEAGRITGANTSARRLWQSAGHELVGERYASLFAFEVVSTDPDFLENAWLALANDLDRDLVLASHPRPGVPSELQVRLERQSGEPGGYIATLQPARPAPASSTETSPHQPAWAILTEKAAAGFFDLNLKIGRVEFSPAWKRLLGYAPSELPDVIETWRQLIHPEDSAAAPDKVARKLASTGIAASRPFSVEFRMWHRSGHWIWIHCIGVQTLAADGELERVVGFHLDISERKEIEDTLIANDARLQALTQDGPLAAFEIDFAGGPCWYSPAFARLLGHGGESLPATSEPLLDALPEDASEDLESWLQTRAPGESVFTEPVRLRAGDGSTVPALLGIHRILTRRGALLRVMGFVAALPSDLSDLSEVASPQLTAVAMDILSEAIVVTDARGVILLANAASARLLRLAPAAIRGHPVPDVLRLLNRQTQRPSENPVARALAADTTLPLCSDDCLAPIDGEPFPVVWSARAARNADGLPVGVVIVLRNPEEMTLTPEELVRANRFETLGLLAGGIAHDFNNLLTTILGAVSLGRDNRDYSALGDAEQACLAAKALTKQLLAFAKGSSSGTRTVCAPKDILNDSAKIASAASSAEITITVAETTAPVLVERGQMLQVFQNLMVNALQAMPPEPHQPQVQISARNALIEAHQVQGLEAGEYVEFEVRDNGNGIPPEYVEKIFDPFFTTKKHGTGLGLATVLSIVRKHGGQITLDTQIGVGAVFTIYLPQANEAVNPEARRAASLRFGTGRILFMDDDPRICSLTATMLESLDYHCDLAKDGASAIALYKRYLNIGRPYDAVIMDLTVIGGMGGEQCFHELKQLDPDVRAIIASGYDNEDMARGYLEQGFCGYLTKPYRVADLGKLLKTVLG